MNNIWLFIPLGGILARLGLGWKSVIICALLSLCIEVIQYFTSLGFAEFDDIISNTFGGLIGVFFCAMVQRKKNRTDMSRLPD